MCISWISFGTDFKMYSINKVKYPVTDGVNWYVYRAYKALHTQMTVAVSKVANMICKLTRLLSQLSEYVVGDHSLVMARY